jgi:hypothetical protein
MGFTTALWKKNNGGLYLTHVLLTQNPFGPEPWTVHWLPQFCPVIKLLFRRDVLAIEL